MSPVTLWLWAAAAATFVALVIIDVAQRGLDLI